MWYGGRKYLPLRYRSLRQENKQTVPAFLPETGLADVMTCRLSMHRICILIHTMLVSQIYFYNYRCLYCYRDIFYLLTGDIIVYPHVVSGKLIKIVDIGV